MLLLTYNSATLLNCHTRTDVYEYLSEYIVFIAVPHTCDTHDTMNDYAWFRNYVVCV